MRHLMTFQITGHQL